MAEFARMGNAEQVPIVVHRLSSDQRESGEIKPVVFYERLETLVLEGKWRKKCDRFIDRAICQSFDHIQATGEVWVWPTSCHNLGLALRPQSRYGNHRQPNYEFAEGLD